MTRRSVNLTDKSDLAGVRMAAVDITRDYFNSMNRMKLPGYKEKCHSGSFKKPNFTESPNEAAEMLFLDDSGYISPEFSSISPFHLEGHHHHKNEIQDVSSSSSMKVLSNHHGGNVVHTARGWEEPEEEDVAGKMQFRRGEFEFPLELTCWNFTKKYADLFDDSENVIGKRIGRTHCDIVSKLHQKGVTDFLSKLMGYVAPKDVSNMCLVSKGWLECCTMNRTAQQKLKDLKKSMKVKRCHSNKENIITVQLEKAKLKPKRITKSELFKECANILKKDECLQKCPKCEHPAKVRPVQERGVCMNSSCGYHYCSKCRARYHGSDACYQVGTKRITKEVVNTRTAKKYLRRL